MADLQKDEHLLNYSNQFTITNNEEVMTNLELEEASIETTVGIEGSVKTQLNEGIYAATVKLFDLDFNPIMHAETDSNGNYIMTNVPAGDYQIFAIKEGYYLSAQRYTTITNQMVLEPSIVLNPMPVEQSGVLYGYAKDEDGTALGSVNVNLYKDDVIKYSTLSADDGEYIINGIEPGDYKLEAHNSTFKTDTFTDVTIPENTNVNVDIVVDEYYEDLRGTINGIITDKTTKQPIEDAFVGLYQVVNGKEVLIAGTITDEKGRYFFGKLFSGTYLVKAKSSKIDTI